VRIDSLTDFVDSGALAVDHGRPVRVQQRRIDVLVIHHQQSVIALVPAVFGIDWEEMHAIVMHAGLVRLVLGAVTGVLQIGRIAPADGGAPRDERRCGVSRRDADAIVASNWNR